MTDKFRSLVAVIITLATCQMSKAVDIYVIGNDNGTSTDFFGKVNSTTGALQIINANIGAKTSGGSLVWNPNINMFNSLSGSGVFNTIMLDGTLGTPIASGLQAGKLGYSSTSSKMYNVLSTFYDVNPTTGAQTSVGATGYSDVYSATPVGNLIYGTVFVFSGGPKWYYGTFNSATGAFAAITASDSVYGAMRLAYDGTTMYGMNNSSLYIINPATGAYSSPVTLSGISGLQSLQGAAMVPVPEPSTYALGAIATGVMAAVARRRKASRV